METCRKWAPIALSLVALAASAIVGISAASADRQTLINGQDNQAARLDDHETRLRDLERQIPAMARDVEAILDTCKRLETRIDAHYATDQPGRRMPANLDDARP